MIKHDTLSLKQNKINNIEIDLNDLDKVLQFLRNLCFLAKVPCRQFGG